MSNPHEPCAAPDPNPRPPKYRLPPGACDCHIHVVPQDTTRYPYVDGRPYTPATAPVEAYEHLMRVTGLSRSVIVQPTFYGTDNRATLDPLIANPDRYRAVVVVAPTVTDAELQKMHATGARGMRYNIATGSAVLSFEDVQALAPRLRRMGWHLQLFVRAADFGRLRDSLLRLEIPLVLDHMGGPDAAKGVDDPGFRRLVDSVAAGECWVKLSGAYRITRLADGSYRDVLPFAQAFVAANAAQCIWGSDWPHPHFSGPMPNDGVLLDLLADWVPDEATRRRILVDNPARLYGWV